MSEITEYLARIGGKGGRVKSEAKRSASVSNWAKALEARARRPIGRPYRKRGLSVAPPVKVVDAETGRISYPPEVRYVPVPVVAQGAPLAIVPTPVAKPRPRRDFMAGFVPEVPRPKVVHGANWSGRPVGETTREPFVDNP